MAEFDKVIAVNEHDIDPFLTKKNIFKKPYFP